MIVTLFSEVESFVILKNVKLRLGAWLAYKMYFS